MYGFIKDGEGAYLPDNFIEPDHSYDCYCSAAYYLVGLWHYAQSGFSDLGGLLSYYHCFGRRLSVGESRAFESV